MREIGACILGVLGLLCPLGNATSAEPSKSADVGPPQTIAIATGREHNGSFLIAGRDACQQLMVTGSYAGGLVRDLTRQVNYEAMPAGIVHIDATGMVTPRQEGEAIITAKLANGGPTATAKVRVTNLVQDIPVNFTNQIVPVFTKFGCNAGGCHGKASGQNGFKLSLLGFEPAEDYESLVKEARGRRLFPAAPEHSLLLLKAVGGMPHGGGKRIDKNSPFYRVMLRWVEQGSPFGRPSDPVVQRIELLPKERLMDRGSEQQLVVAAHLSDGSTMDVTRMTQFESNHPDMAEVSMTGLVGIQQLPGSVAIMARFQSHVDVFRVTVPLGAPVEKLPPAKNFVDELVFKQLKKLGLPPSDLCDDATFIRRATLDIAGRLPKKEEIQEFVADKDDARHGKLIERLLASDGYADYFANKWSAILRNRRKAPTDDPKPTAAFHAWIRQSLRENKPYDRFVREVLTASGEEMANPPVLWYREVKEPTAQVEDTAQLFLGQRIGCARCHHHPFEKWSQQDYWGLAAFFSRLDVKEPPAAKAKGKKGAPEVAKVPFSVAHKSGVAQVVDPKTHDTIRPTALGGQQVAIDNADDPRPKLVDWMAAKDNPFFAKALVNRYWKHFFGRGLVDPEDDMRVTNPATNPELLDALAKHFIDSNYDLTRLIHTICASHVYRFSALPNQHNADDRQNFSRYIPKRLHAEVLLDAIDDVTLAKSAFKGFPAGTRAVQLPDNQVESYFLSVFGRPDSASACECERSSDATLAQCLHMFNSTELLAKVKGPRLAQLVKDNRPHEEGLRELYIAALARAPSKEEMAALSAHVDKKKDVQTAYEDILWALLNTKEFLFNH
jgi:hypothetical protein